MYGVVTFKFCFKIFTLLCLFAPNFAAHYRNRNTYARYFTSPESELEIDYDDFSEVPKYLRHIYNLPKNVKDDQLVDVFLPPKKRYRKYF